MAWTDQSPPATDILLSAHFSTSDGRRVWIEVDKLERKYRATAGNLFGSQEITRNRDLESVLRTIWELCGNEDDA
jgi:hypothetical protein